MSETDLAARLDAVERALTDDGTDPADLRDLAELAATVEDLQARVDELEETVAELDAGLQAVRGYAGNVRAVNREVERRASAALAKAETLESSLDDLAHTDERPVRRAREADDARENSVSDRADRERRGSQRDTRRDASARSSIANDRDRTSTDSGSGDRPDRSGRMDRGDPAGRSDRTDLRDRDGADDEPDDGTEQFIQRVREAL